MRNRDNPLRKSVFLPSFVLVVLTIFIATFKNDIFLEITTYVKDVMIVQFGGLFSLTGMAFLVLVVVAYFSPFGNIKMGGKDAKPLMKKHSCVFIVLCTTLAAGILFWGTEETIYHLAYPPKSLGIEPMSAHAAKYAIETMYLHWTFIPYALYTVPILVFSFMYYNHKKPFSIGSQITLLTKERHEKLTNSIVDAVSLFTICFGIAASFGMSIISVGGGISYIFGVSNSINLWIVIAILTSTAFIISAGSGLFKGIKYLSSINIYIFLIIIAILLFVGPTSYIFNGAVEAFGGFFTGLPEKALFTGTFANDSWPKNWTTFYWTLWIAWAPVSAVFLSRLSYGYTVKEIIIINFLLPSMFSMLWMSILGGASIYLQTNGLVDILNIVNTRGVGTATYAVISYFPLSRPLSIIYIFAVFISFVTATDSVLNAMAGISTYGISDGRKEAPLYVKILWGVLITSIALIFIGDLGLDGIRTLSYLGGIPSLVLCILCAIVLCIILKNYKILNKLDNNKK